LSKSIRDAATVALLRDGSAGPEVFLLRRVRGMAFAAGMSVFTGGSVDPSDASPVEWVGPPPAQWTGPLSAEEPKVAALVSAAVRETFEESGVLLAGGDVPADLAAERRALERHESSLADVLNRHGLAVRADLLRPWAHWITPEGEQRRYDTRFFVAAVPPGQQTSGLTSEADIAEWVRPADALAEYEAGERPLMLPTRATLRELAAFDSVDAVLDAAGRRSIEPILPVLRDGVAELP